MESKKLELDDKICQEEKTRIKKKNIVKQAATVEIATVITMVDNVIAAGKDIISEEVSRTSKGGRVTMDKDARDLDVFRKKDKTDREKKAEGKNEIEIDCEDEDWYDGIDNGF